MPQINTKNSNGKYESDYPFSFSTSSVIPYIYDADHQKFLIVGIVRGQEPYKGKLAFAGGFQEAGKESLEKTAVRELLEETGIRKDEKQLKLITVQSNPNRDPRGVIIDHVYAVGVTAKDLLEAHAGDDASSLKLIEVDKDRLHSTVTSEYQRKQFVSDFAFDHGFSLIEFYRKSDF